MNRDEEQVKSLLKERKVDVNMKDIGGRTVLHLTVISYLDIDFNEKSNDHINNILKILLEYGADLMIEDEVFHWRPLYLAVMIEAWYVVGFLMQWKVDYKDLNKIKRNIKNDVYVQKILKTAIKNGFYGLVKFMLESGIHVDYSIQEKVKLTMLHVAVKYGKLKWSSFL